MHIDPVCGKKMNPNKAHVTIKFKGHLYYLCCPRCQSEFESDPKKYVPRDLDRGGRRAGD